MEFIFANDGNLDISRELIFANRSILDFSRNCLKFAKFAKINSLMYHKFCSFLGNGIVGTVSF